MSDSKPLTVSVKPSIDEAEKIVREAISQRKTLLVVGNCWVHYMGRAKSKLEPGERILIVKEDGSLLVHRSVGYEPVNWQPPGCIFHTQSKAGVLEVRAVRQKPPESVQVFFDKVHFVSALSLKDSGEFSLYASEEDMQKAILLEPSLLEEGFKPISYEKKVEPGFMDVYGVDKDGRFVVVEIKRKTAGREAALQLAKYLEAVKSRTNREVRGILAAPNIAKDVQRLLETLGLEFKALNPKKCAEILKRAETMRLEAFFREE
ncbi:MAG: endonuclease NucS [Nitrososphaerota archaeon]|nr:endonuclease NucS [Candidatus Bathyarchaeota archaeon]MDW8024094.1 endonuclease NucS [Nitrososphaerota archaeon]